MAEKYYDSSWIPASSAHCDMPEEVVIKSKSNIASAGVESTGNSPDKWDEQMNYDAAQIKAITKRR